MRTFTWIALSCWLAGASMPMIAYGKSEGRSLSYTFQRSRTLVVTVVIDESSSRPRGEIVVVQFMDASQKRIPFSMSQAQFDKVWSLFTSSGVDKYPMEHARHTIDLAYYYVFSAGNQKYAVPRKRASPDATMLASRMQAYASDKAIGFQSVPKANQPSGLERVIIH